MLAGVAERLAIDPELLDDLKTAVSEACNNVVLHAYGGDPGPMRVALLVDHERIRVTVEDDGVGVPGGMDDHGQGIGLSVIRALSDDVRLHAGPRGGSRIEMDFAARRAGQTLLEAPDTAGPDTDWTLAEPDEIVVSLSPVTLLSGILGRLARTLAATAHFSLDRFSDVYLVTDALAAHAIRAASGPRISARLAVAERRLELLVGPFRLGAGELLQASPGGSGPSALTLLSDEISVRTLDNGELVRVVVIDRRR